jgi:hypothetical protein
MSRFDARRRLCDGVGDDESATPARAGLRRDRSMSSELSRRVETPDATPEQPAAPEGAADSLFGDPDGSLMDRVADDLDRRSALDASSKATRPPVDEEPPWSHDYKDVVELVASRLYPPEPTNAGPSEDDAPGPDEAEDETGDAEDASAFEALYEEGRALHDRIPLDRWTEANLHDRAELAQEVHTHIRDRYGLSPAELRVDSEMEDGVYGAFDPDTGHVILNQAVLSEDRPSELIDTLAHENRHALQEEIRSGRTSHPLGELGKGEIEEWRKGALAYDAADLRGPGYGYNALEVDAYKAGSQMAIGYRDALIDDLLAEREERQRAGT